MDLPQVDDLDADEDGNALEEDAADVAARRRAAAKAREEAELKLRSQVRALCLTRSWINQGQPLCILARLALAMIKRLARVETSAK